jgi:hypothetical protein
LYYDLIESCDYANVVLKLKFDKDLENYSLKVTKTENGDILFSQRPAVITDVSIYNEVYVEILYINNYNGNISNSNIIKSTSNASINYFFALQSGFNLFFNENADFDLDGSYKFSPIDCEDLDINKEHCEYFNNSFRVRIFVKYLYIDKIKVKK